MFGLIPAGVTCNTILGFGDRFEFTVGRGIAFGLAAIPFLLVYILSRRENNDLFFSW